jgi:hypothetical protein
MVGRRNRGCHGEPTPWCGAVCQGGAGWSNTTTPLVAASRGGWGERLLRWGVDSALRASLLVSPRPAALLVRRVCAAGGAQTARVNAYVTACMALCFAHRGCKRRMAQSIMTKMSSS